MKFMPRSFLPRRLSFLLRPRLYLWFCGTCGERQATSSEMFTSIQHQQTLGSSCGFKQVNKPPWIPPTLHRMRRTGRNLCPSPPAFLAAVDELHTLTVERRVSALISTFLTYKTVKSVLNNFSLTSASGLSATSCISCCC